MSESEPEPSLDPAGAGTVWGIPAQGCRAKQRGRGGMRHSPRWNQAPGSCAFPDTCGHLLDDHASFTHSFIRSARSSVTQRGSRSLLLQPGIAAQGGTRHFLPSKEEEGGRRRACAQVSLGRVGLEVPVGLLPVDGRGRGYWTVCSSR